MKIFLVASVLLLPYVAFADAAFPPDVQSFIEDRDGCDHFRGEPWDAGEEPETKDRREFIFKNIKELCTGTDDKLAELRTKYSSNATVTNRLKDYESKIERK
jgi:hypothetical protein